MTSDDNEEDDLTLLPSSLPILKTQATSLQAVAVACWLHLPLEIQQGDLPPHELQQLVPVREDLREHPVVAKPRSQDTLLSKQNISYILYMLCILYIIQFSYLKLYFLLYIVHLYSS